VIAVAWGGFAAFCLSTQYLVHRFNNNHKEQS
jgi:hypothetical protein